MTDKSLNPFAIMFTVDRPVAGDPGTKLTVSMINNKAYNAISRMLYNNGINSKILHEVNSDGTDSRRFFLVPDSEATRSIVDVTADTFLGFELIKLDNQGCAFRASYVDQHGHYLGAFKRLPHYLRANTKHLIEKATGKSWRLWEGYFGRSAA